jgi:hypothetical protein
MKNNNILYHNALSDPTPTCHSNATLPNHIHINPQPINIPSQLLLTVRTLPIRRQILHPTLRAAPKVRLLDYLIQRKRASRRICLEHVVRPLRIPDGVALRSGAGVVSFGLLGIGPEMRSFRGAEIGDAFGDFG